jgi:hypothetical protein
MVGKPAQKTSAEHQLASLVEMLRDSFHTLRKGEVREFEDVLGEIVKDFSGEELRVPADQLPHLHQTLREAVRGFVLDEPRRWVLPHGTVHLERAGPGDPFHFSTEAHGSDAVPWGVMNLLLKAGHLLEKCPVCSDPFIRNRRQEYCSLQCSQLVRDRRRAEKKRQKH